MVDVGDIKSLLPSSAQLASEFVGTYLLVLTVACNIINQTSVFAAVSIAAVLMVSIYALGPISGANFNPAVSLALSLTYEAADDGGDRVSKQPWLTTACYIGVQLVGACTAATTYFGIFGQVIHLGPKPGFTWAAAMLVETVFTFLLCFVVLNVAATEGYGGSKKANQFYGVAIGFVIVAGGYAGGWISGGVFNPAVAVGIDMLGLSTSRGAFLAYTLFELLGAAAAAAAFRVIRPGENKENSGTMENDGKKGATPQLFCEFLGTFILVFTIGLNVLQGPSNHAAVYSIAAALLVSIFAMGDVSGGHFNPAVSIAIYCLGHCEAEKMAKYISVQIVGGIAAAMVYTLLVQRSFPLGPGPGFGWASVCVVEFIFTTLLCFTVLSVCFVEGKKLPDYAGLAIAFTIVAGGYAIGGISGGALNPAVSIGIDVANSLMGGIFWACLPYVGAQAAAGGAAAGMYYLTRLSKQGKQDEASA
mmetsp:Transcript_71456/g.190542  ORF Transcript_71456/g.190542 Transcript_71456/m.190542 type:complete len:475 (-) Transcript_71456:15-1439(-)